jgi:hypothetical protein
MAYTRSEGTGETPRLQRALDEAMPRFGLARDTFMEHLEAHVAAWTEAWRANEAWRRQRNFPPDALEVE